MVGDQHPPDKGSSSCTNGERPPVRYDVPVEITFRPDGTLGAGRYISVLVGDRMVGRIFHTGGTHRFYEGHDAKRATLQTTDLEQLKTALRARYDAS